MIPLLVFNLKHIFRTKLLILIFVFTFLIQFLTLKLMGAVTLQVQGALALLGPNRVLYVALTIQLFTGAFLSAIYGIWMVPYAHVGQRGQLTYTLPVSRWVYPVVYGLLIFLLLALQNIILLVSFGLVQGFETFLLPDFRWSGLLLCIALETLAFEVCMFAFALGSMTLGQIPTFFLGAVGIFVMQISAAFLRFNPVKLWEDGGRPTYVVVWQWIYDKLPPIGELLFDMRDLYLRAKPSNGNIYLWIVWLVILFLAFRLKLNFSTNARSSET